MLKKQTCSILAVGMLFLWAVPPAALADGHCNFRQLAPKLREWVRACQSPATAQTCDDLVSEQKQQLEYGDGDCSTGAIGLCVVGNDKVFFYQGDPDDLARGCQFMNGSWRPDLLPPG